MTNPNRQEAMTNLENAVLAKLKTDFIRKKLRTGQHHIDFKIHLAGDVWIEEDQKVTPTAELSVYGVLVTALLEQGIDPNRVLNIIERTVRHALKREQKFNEQLTARAQELIDDIRKRFAEKLPKVFRAGAIKLDVDIKRIT